MILGVDRLDYTKGLPEKMRGFERLLELHPEHREKVVLLQIAQLSRERLPEYQRLKRQVDELVGRVNGRFATSQWIPIHYLHRSLTQEEVAGLYRDADVALVTPLRDGMNLVAKEFVSCQTDDPGVLVLSVLAGAAETMGEAMLVNPYDTDGVAETLHTALTMDRAERTERMRALQRRERINDVHAWVERFLERARAPLEKISPIRPEDFSPWLGPVVSAQRLALFLDFDGTLAEIANHPNEARLSDAMRERLTACAARTDTDVAIVTGRAASDIRSVEPPPGVILIGNHGFEIAGPGGLEFVHPDLPRVADKMAHVARTLSDDCPPGCWVEHKGASLTVHFRNATRDDAARIAAEGRWIASEYGLSARDALSALEIRPSIDWDKGDAVLYVLRSLHGMAWSESVEAIYAGDDETDEDAFRALRGLGVTFRVGRADQPTLASHRLPNVLAVEALLGWVAGR
jgi:trehalose 6-phosphate synthase/phosphatase